MHVEMDKLEENQTFVFYRFEIEILKRITVDGKIDYENIVKAGFCKFNKISEEFELDKIKTDPCFFEWPHDCEAKYVRIELIVRKREGRGFPDRIIIQRPG